jgi:hypothetical protein
MSILYTASPVPFLTAYYYHTCIKRRTTRHNQHNTLLYMKARMLGIGIYRVSIRSGQVWGKVDFCTRICSKREVQMISDIWIRRISGIRLVS